MMETLVIPNDQLSPDNSGHDLDGIMAITTDTARYDIARPAPLPLDQYHEEHIWYQAHRPALSLQPSSSLHPCIEWDYETRLAYFFPLAY
nr:hypothetical protein Iba_chr11dCG13990 [Ipomoea batatas]